ncbi:prevent-host-death protein [Variovorax sp. WS11]|uniref:type II toxin-antitoxin system Phd/YefM family antitoxin n=1 Tax=Variovorax sp. WS11 TaxID=1105204 RepID=UPI000D0D70CC|nr:type II toxin-antitoxin system Phd/YefM family antitoxin [Variovorax sp. WS11]NDZ15448.1 type II toxin-antitoxin system Phd/YefM family antitoxin [Variovorax sp. WS11]PSL84801.1 prevent-host-death protein [Variovorax sp. WS11]
MKVWPAHDVENRFSEVLDACLSEGPQLVTRNGIEVAVIVPADLWRAFNTGKQTSLKDVLLSEVGRTEALVPPRGALRRRRPAAFGKDRRSST